MIGVILDLCQIGMDSPAADVSSLMKQQLGKNDKMEILAMTRYSNRNKASAIIRYGPDLKCIPIDCGPPEEIPNGKLIGDCTSFRCRQTYSCQPGFEAIGRSTRICGADGAWTQSQLPTCISVQVNLASFII